MLFSHFRPRDATRGNSFFQMSSYARANVRLTNEKKKENSHEGITWSQMENKIYKLERFIPKGLLRFSRSYIILFNSSAILLTNSRTSKDRYCCLNRTFCHEQGLARAPFYLLLSNAGTQTAIKLSLAFNPLLCSYNSS